GRDRKAPLEEAPGAARICALDRRARCLSGHGFRARRLLRGKPNHQFRISLLQLPWKRGGLPHQGRIAGLENIHMIGEKPRITGKTAAGIEEWGPSGASVWSAPTLDTKRRLLYVTTGDNFSKPATAMSDSIVALELSTGRIVWSKQTTPGD